MDFMDFMDFMDGMDGAVIRRGDARMFRRRANWNYLSEGGIWVGLYLFAKPRQSDQSKVRVSMA